MQTKMLVKKPDPSSSGTNNPVSNKQKTKPAANKKNVRTTDYKKLLQIMLTNPDAITRDEFMLLQSAIGYRRAVELRGESKQRKQQRILGQANAAMNCGLPLKTRLEAGKDTDSKKEASETEHENRKVPLQMKQNDSGAASSTPDMSHNLRAGLEKLSGVDLLDVKVHKNSDKPKQVGALAYTQGNDIFVVPGQEKHIPHEGWHVVQQKQGRVEPTMQLKTGTPVNDDSGLEKEADVMGARAAKEGSQESVTQLKKASYVPGRKSGIIQRITQEEAIRISKENTHTQVKTPKDEIIPSAFGEKSENVSKIQQVLIRMNYWTGEDKITGYFGDVTKDSLIKYQLGYMKLKEKDLYNKGGSYVGCGPQTAKSLNGLYKLLFNSNLPEQAKNGIMALGKSKERNSSYGWDIKAGVYNGNVKEAQLLLMNLGYQLPKYGADGKWSNKGETYKAILSYQTNCKNTLTGLKKNGTAENLKQIEHYQGIEPTGRLDEKTYKALQKGISNKVNIRGAKPKSVKNKVDQGTGNDDVAGNVARGELIDIQSYLVNKWKFNGVNQWAHINHIGNGVLSIDCKKASYSSDTGRKMVTCANINVNLNTISYGGKYYASHSELLQAMSDYFEQKTRRGIYQVQWDAEGGAAGLGSIYGVNPNDQFLTFATDADTSVVTYTNQCGPMWEAKYASRTREDDWNDLQTGLDILSCFPVAFIPAQGANILIDFVRGNEKEALLRAGLIVAAEVAGRLIFKAVGSLFERLKNIDNAAEMKLVLRDVTKAYQKAGLTAEKIDNVLSIPKGWRPNPSGYLTSDYIASHLAKFEGGVTKISPYTPSGTYGPPGGTFVMPKSVAEDLITKSGGDISKLEKLLGFTPGYLGKNPVRVDIPAPRGLRMPSGNEVGAIDGKWIPGGYTSGGIPEAIIDSPKADNYIVKKLFD